ncbi:hypothetical protein D6764_01965 [Candidatus Woesearchaeota archaeon]|nr:MAG: hypothetical protein D6764_01965 [Candidatus Woesearchaeota archaeon]
MNGAEKQAGLFRRIALNALFLVAAALSNSQSVAAASKLSELSNNEWVKLVANTVMLGAILFVIYIYSVPSEKEDKTKRGMIILAVIGLCGALAYQFMTDVWFWQVPIVKAVFHLKVITNLLVTAAFLFAAFTLAQALSDDFKNQMQQTASKYAAIVIILMLTFNVALGPFFHKGKIKDWSEVEPDYKYVWEKPDVKSALRYLFGDSKCFDDEGRQYCYREEGAAEGDIEGYGILRPPYIVVFFLGLLLAIWSFKTFNLVTDIKWLQYIFAFVISAGVAHSGLSYRGFARIAQIVTVIVVHKSLKTSDSDMNNGLAWGLSLAIVGTIFHYVFPDYQWALFDWVFSLGTIAAWIILVAGGSIIGLIIFGWMKKDEKKKESRWWQDFKVNAGNWVKKQVLVNKWLKPVKAVANFFNMNLRRETPEGELNSLFRELNVEFMALMDYMLRLEVFAGKHKTVSELLDQVRDAYRTMVSPTHSFHSLFREITLYKHGVGYKIDSDGTVSISPKRVMGRDCNGRARNIAAPKDDGSEDYKISQEKDTLGALEGHYYLYSAFKALKSYVEPVKVGEPNLSILDTEHEPAEQMKKQIISGFETPFEKAQDNYKKLVTSDTNRIKRYGALNKIYAIRNMVLDQYLMHGAYAHTYIFGHPEAEVELVEANKSGGSVVPGEVVSPDKARTGKYKLSPDPMVRPGKAISRRSRLGWLDEGLRMPHEVTPEGYVVEDLNSFNVEGGNGYFGYIRKIKPEDMVWGNFTEVMNWLNQEWEGFLDDLRDGRYHPLSRKVSDYVECHKKKDFAYKTLKRSSDTPSRENPAFDREALKNPGGFVYWGRKKYYEEDLKNINKNTNPYPTLTTIGMTQYLKDLVIAQLKSEREALESLSRWVYDTGAKERGLFTRMPTEAASE